MFFLFLSLYVAPPPLLLFLIFVILGSFVAVLPGPLFRRISNRGVPVHRTEARRIGFRTAPTCFFFCVCACSVRARMGIQSHADHAHARVRFYKRAFECQPPTQQPWQAKSSSLSKIAIMRKQCKIYREAWCLRAYAAYGRHCERCYKQHVERRAS